MANNNSDQQPRPAKAGPNPWGPAPYSLTYAIFLITIITVSNFFWGNNDGSVLCKVYTGFMAFALLCAICILITDGTLFLIRSPQRREKLVRYRDRTIWISAPAASVGFSLVSFHEAKHSRFRMAVSIIIAIILAIVHIYMAYQIAKDMKSTPPVEEEAHEGGDNEVSEPQ